MKRFISFFVACFIFLCFTSNLNPVDAAEISDFNFDTPLELTESAIDFYDNYFTDDFDYSEISTVLTNLSGVSGNFSVVKNYLAGTGPFFPVAYKRATVLNSSSGYVVFFLRVTDLNDHVSILDYNSENSELCFKGYGYVVSFRKNSSYSSGFQADQDHSGAVSSTSSYTNISNAMNSKISGGTVLPIPCKSVEKKELKFTFSDNFENHMQLENYNDNFTITAENTTDNRYNYIIYITDSPVSSVSSSFNNAKYIMSSSQWCNKYVSGTVTPSDVSSAIGSGTLINQLADSAVSSLFGSLGSIIYDSFGNSFDPVDLYVSANTYSVQFYRTSFSRCPYYSISGLKNQPIHHRNPVSVKNHVIAFKDLGLEIGKQYYFNIAYLDVSDIETMSYNKELQNLFPLYNSNLLSSFSLYSSTPFSFDSGTFIKNDSDMYNASDFYNSSNTSNSDGFLNGSDNSVTTNNNTNISDDHRNIYYNYGTIYHGCSNFLNGSSGSSGSGSIPDLPDADFKELVDQTGNFFDFIKSIWIASGWLPAALFVTAVTVAIFCRVAGR